MQRAPERQQQRSCLVQHVLFHTPQLMVWCNSMHRSDPFFPGTSHLPPLWAEAGTSLCFLAPLRRSCSGYLPHRGLHLTCVLRRMPSHLCAMLLHLLFRVQGYLPAYFLPVLALVLAPWSPLTQDIRTTELKFKHFTQQAHLF